MKGTLLAIDDDPINLDILQEMFPQEEYELVLCDTAQEGLDHCKESPPQVLLLDIMMPYMNGYDVCRYIREELGDNDMHIVMLTGKILTSDRVEAFKVGVNDYITKPFTEEELKLKVNYYLQQGASD